MENQLFELKLTAKQLARSSKKCEANEKKEKKKIKDCIQKQRMENARTHAENAIREKNQAVTYLRLSARIEAVSQRIETGLRMRQVTKAMSGVVKGMEKAQRSMNLVQMTTMLDRFEQGCEDFDTQMDVMDSAMSSTSAMSTPEGEVNELIKMVADEHSLEVNEEMMNPGMKVGGELNAPVAAPKDDLQERLARLRQATE